MQFEMPIFKGIKRKKKEGFISELSDELVNVEIMISNIENSEISIDIEQEKLELDELRQEIDANYITSEKVGTSIIGVYQSMTDKLMNIKSRIIKYESLILLMNKAYYLENACKSGEVAKDFNSFVSLCLEILTDLDKIKVSIVSKYKDSYEKIYRIIYEFIKIEISHTLESKVLESLVSQKTADYYINNIMRDEINNIKERTFNNPKLISRLDMLTNKNTSSSLASDIVSKDVIFTIVLITNEEEVIKSLNSKMNGIRVQYGENLEEINSYLYSNSGSDDPVGKIVQSKIDLEHHRQQLKETNKELKKKLIALIISTTLVTAIGLNLPSIGKHFNTKYVTTTEIYETGKEPISLSSYEEKASDIKRTLDIYSETYEDWGKTYTDYKKYDVTDVIIESVSEEDYLYIDVDSFGLKSYESRQENVTEESKEVRQLTVVKQDHVNGSILDEDDYRTFLIIAYLVLAFESIWETIGPLNNFIKCIKLINDGDSRATFVNIFYEELRKLIKECEKYIKSNKDLEAEYYSIYDELKYLTTEEIEDKLKSLTVQNSEYKKTLKAYKE